MVIIGGASLVRQCLSADLPEATGETAVAQVSRAIAASATCDGRLASLGLATAAAVVTPTRGGPGRAQEGRRPGRRSRSHRASSCCRRIHSASTIAAASSSRLVAHAVLGRHVTYPFPECCAPGPASEVDRVRR